MIPVALCMLALAGCGEKKAAEPAAGTAEVKEQTVEGGNETAGAPSGNAETTVAADFSDLSEEYQPWADKYMQAAEKLSQCLPVDGADMSPEEIRSELTAIAAAIDKQAMSDAEKTSMDMLMAAIDNLSAQSKNLCDTKLNDIIALSQGDYTGEFEQQMQQERQYYDDLINSGKYKDAYDQLTRMEEMYRANQS